MESPRQRNSGLIPGILLLVFGVTFFVITALLPSEFRDQWQPVIVIIQVLFTVALVGYLAWFVRKQRDDYWRERGKDPRHPER